MILYSRSRKIAIGMLCIVPIYFSVSHVVLAQQGANSRDIEAEDRLEKEANKQAAIRHNYARSLIGKNSIFACNGDERKGYTSPNAVTLEPTRGLEKELCVKVPANINVTKWACEFASDRKSQFCKGIEQGACEVVGWVWPIKPTITSDGNFNKYCITGYQDSDREWRYFNIHLYNDSMQ